MFDVAVRELLPLSRAGFQQQLQMLWPQQGSIWSCLVPLQAVDVSETELARWLYKDLLESETVVMPALRLLLFKHAHPGLLPDYSTPVLQTGISLPAAPSTSWTETFALKLDAAMISALKSAFETSNPSGSLEPEFIPSTRLLSHVHKMVASRDLAFVPWKFILNVDLHREHQSSRPAQKARFELTDLWLDEVPSRHVPASGIIGMFHLQQLLSLSSVSLAFCKASSLQTPRTYERALCAWPVLSSRLMVASERHAWKSCRRRIGRCGVRSMLCFKGGGPWMMLCTRFAMYAAFCRRCFSRGLRFLCTTHSLLIPRGWASHRTLASRKLMLPRSRRLLVACVTGRQHTSGSLG